MYEYKYIFMQLFKALIKKFRIYQYAMPWNDKETQNKKSVEII
jgi:hypothetical protein